MLQSCSTGLVVVNIDNGVGAGAAAVLIAQRRLRGRSQATIGEHDRAKDQQAEKDRKRRARQVGAARRGAKTGPRPGLAKPTHDQQPRKAAAPAAVEEQPQRAWSLFRLAHSRPAQLGQRRDRRDAVAAGSPSACAVQMTARMPTARGPS